MEDNLDQECFDCSICIIEKADTGNKKKAKELLNSITKSLGVLEENGVFAFYVYLKSEGKNENVIEEKTIKLLKNVLDPNLDKSLKKIKLLGDDIKDLLLAKSLLEKTLIYARYQAKSLSG